MLLDRDTMIGELQSNPAIGDLNRSARELLAALWVFSAIGMFWSLAAAVLALLAFRRVQVARAALLVSSGATVVVGVLTLAGLFHAMAAVAVIVLLLGPRTNAWFRSAGTPPPPPAWRPPPQRPPPPPKGRGPKPPVW
jgi:hypothetical protein